MLQRKKETDGDDKKIMIRKEVENLRGHLFTMEEMCDIIISIIETSLCMRMHGHVNEENTTLTLMNCAGDILELEGTEKQFEAFEAERKQRNGTLFPNAMSLIETVSLALEHGLSVKKVILNKRRNRKTKL